MPWLTARRLPRTLPMPADTCWLRPDPQRFARDLAALGPVFCLWARAPASTTPVSPAIAAGSPDSQVLARPGALSHACAVTLDGPREWITVHDQAGIARCRLHLLPDTDYLAWDALVAHAGPMSAPDVPSTLRARHGRRLCFDVQTIGPWALVCARPVNGCCPLSARTAQELARAEGVALLA